MPLFRTIQQTSARRVLPSATVVACALTLTIGIAEEARAQTVPYVAPAELAQHQKDAGAFANTIDVKQLGAKGDGSSLNDCVTAAGSSSLTCADGSFSAADVGKKIAILGAGTYGLARTLVTTIAGFRSPTAITLGANATATLTHARTWYASDDTATVQRIISTRAANGGTLLFRRGIYWVDPLTVGSHTVVLGEGSTATIFVSSFIGNKAVFGGPDNTSYVTIADLAVQKTVVDPKFFNEMVHFRHGDFIYVQNCAFWGVCNERCSGIGEKGVHLEASRNLLVQDNYFSDIADTDVAITWSGSSWDAYATVQSNTTVATGNWQKSSIIVTANHTRVLNNKCIGVLGKASEYCVEIGNNVTDVEVAGNSAVNEGVVVARSGKDINIHDNTARAGGIYVTSAGGPLLHVRLERNVVEGDGKPANIVVNNHNGADAPIADVVVQNNRVTGAAQRGLVVAGANGVVLHGNVVRNAGADGLACIRCANATITGNESVGNGAKTGGHGLYVEASSGNVSDNTVSSNGGAGIFVANGENQVRVERNRATGNAHEDIHLPRR